MLLSRVKCADLTVKFLRSTLNACKPATHLAPFKLCVSPNIHKFKD